MFSGIENDIFGYVFFYGIDFNMLCVFNLGTNIIIVGCGKIFST